MASLVMTSQFRCGHLAQRQLHRLLVVEVDKIDVGGDGKQINAEFGSKKRRSSIFVDNGLDAFDLIPIANYRDSSASARDYEHSLAHQRSNDCLFHDRYRFRRRYDAPVSARRIFDNLPSHVAPALFRLRQRVERTDGLAGLSHRRIISPHFRLCDQADHWHLQTGGPQFVAEGLREQISDFPLAARAANIQSLSRNLVRCTLRTQQLRPDLWTVTVCDDDAMARLNQLDDRGRRAPCIHPLLRYRPFFSRTDQGVSANGNEHRFHSQRQGQFPEVSRRSIWFQPRFTGAPYSRQAPVPALPGTASTPTKSPSAHATDSPLAEKRRNAPSRLLHS